jgi:hypothetical protein
MKRLHVLTAVAAASLLAACGGGGGDDNARGALKETPQTVATVTAAQLDAGTAANGLQPLTGKAKCDVRVMSLNYATVGVNGEATNASAALLVPAGACVGPFPLVAYAKGTDVQKPRTLANPQDSETFLLAPCMPPRAMPWWPPTTWALPSRPTATTPICMRIPRPRRCLTRFAPRGRRRPVWGQPVGQGHVHRLFAGRARVHGGAARSRAGLRHRIQRGGRRPPGGPVQPVGLAAVPDAIAGCAVLCALPGDGMAKGVRHGLHQREARHSRRRIRTTSRPCCPTPR